MTKLSEQFAFESWLKRQIRRRDNTGELARAVADGRIAIYRSHEATIAREIAIARSEYDRLRADGTLKLASDGSIRVDLRRSGSRRGGALSVGNGAGTGRTAVLR
jgi:hypothetical protein